MQCCVLCILQFFYGVHVYISLQSVFLMSICKKSINNEFSWIYYHTPHRNFLRQNKQASFEASCHQNLKYFNTKDSRNYSLIIFIYNVFEFWYWYIVFDTLKITLNKNIISKWIIQNPLPIAFSWPEWLLF